MAKTAFIGLGVMGAPMARHLAAAGHEVAVFNRTKAKADAWTAQYGGRAALNVGDAVAECEFVFACVGADNDVREVWDAAWPSMRKGAVFVDHTTASAALARTLYEEAKARALSFVDAPVSGGQAGAENARLTIMAGGDEAAIAQASPLMRAYGANITHIGPAGSGQLAKMVNQICIAGVVQGLAEGLHFAKRAELDVEKVVQAISKGAAQSWQMENRWKTMVAGEFNFGFAVDWMRKDLGLAFEEAARNGARLEATALIDDFYSELQQRGRGRSDTSSLIARLD